MGKKKKIENELKSLFKFYINNIKPWKKLNVYSRFNRQISQVVRITPLNLFRIKSRMI